MPGTLKAVGRNGSRVVARRNLRQAARAIKLTPTVGPQGLPGRRARRRFIDFEVVRCEGLRCPTDDARVDFTISGPGIWRGGYNSGKIDSTNIYLNTECGINRVSVRSTSHPARLWLPPAVTGLKPAQDSDCNSGRWISERRLIDFGPSASAGTSGRMMRRAARRLMLSEDYLFKAFAAGRTVMVTEVFSGITPSSTVKVTICFPGWRGQGFRKMFVSRIETGPPRGGWTP